MVLLAMAIFIIFVGTLAQIEKGIWTVVDDYFRTFIAWIEIRTLLFYVYDVPGGFYFPGGWLIAVAMLLNLITAHTVRFTVEARGPRLFLGLLIVLAGAAATWLVITGGFDMEAAGGAASSYGRIGWQLVRAGLSALVLLGGCVLIFKKRAGIVLLHAGVILIIVSELITGTFAVEATMTIAEGETVSFLDRSIEYELAIIDPLPETHDDVVVIPHTLLKKEEGLIQHELLPLDVRVIRYVQNTTAPIALSRNPDLKPDPRVTAGAGLRWRLLERPEGSGVGDLARDAPAAYVSFIDKETGKPLGTYLVSLWFYPNFSGRRLDEPQFIKAGGKTYTIYLRNRRQPLRSGAGHRPYSIRLIDFRHDLYVGTNVPRNYSSDVVVADPDRNVVDRQVRIWMNNPLRYGDRVFYQSSFLDNDAGTVLQVVKNAGWMVPYVSCMIVATGLLAQFGTQLVRFLRRRQSQ